MRRADRLFQIVQHLRGGRLVRAGQLAEWLEVSTRTIYRDVADLMASGVPIEGEAGVGYVMRLGYDLPPLMFTHDEITALVAGARMVRAWGGATMARAAEEALVKIEAVLPEAERARAAGVEVYAFAPGMTEELRARIDYVEAAIAGRARLALRYSDEEGAETGRHVRPLGMAFWGKVWTLIGWCELREDFRMFRLDRMAEVVAGGTFRHERGRRLIDFYRSQDRRRR